MNGPSLLLADAILPSLIWIWPITAVLLLPIIVVEAQYARRCLNLMRGQAFRVFAVANVISTVIGFPLATVAANILQIKVQNHLYGNPQLNFEQWSRGGDPSNLARGFGQYPHSPLFAAAGKKFTIDYETRTVSLQLAEVGTTGRSSPLCFVIPLVAQGLQVNLAVDTGLQGIVLYKNRLRKGLPKMRIEGESTNVVMGRLRGTQVRLPGVRIVGGEVVISVILIDGPDDKTLPGVDGYLGPATLQAKRIEFDFGVRVLRWQ